jgi:hypothetical protein
MLRTERNLPILEVPLVEDAKGRRPGVENGVDGGHEQGAQAKAAAATAAAAAGAGGQ